MQATYNVLECHDHGRLHLRPTTPPPRVCPDVGKVERDVNSSRRLENEQSKGKMAHKGSTHGAQEILLRTCSKNVRFFEVKVTGYISDCKLQNQEVHSKKTPAISVITSVFGL